MRSLHFLLSASLALGAVINDPTTQRVTFSGQPYVAQVAPNSGPVGQRTFVYKNVRFADPPTGNYRWNMTRYPPAANSTLGNPNYGPVCPQTPAQADSASMVAGNANFTASGVENEDCLFLDVFVPEEAFTASKALPVVNYIFGGAYIFGSKDNYTGVPFVNSSRDRGAPIIWVVANYRLGALGWMAGPLQKNTPGALANAGFYDQRAVLRWIQDNIAKINGDPTQVTAMGESSGGGSIMFQLMAFKGTQNPLFKRAIIMSPGVLPQWDTASGGFVHNYTKQFNVLAGCSSTDTTLTCLRGKPYSVIKKAMLQLEAQSVIPNPVWGPVVDKVWLNGLQQPEYLAGRVWPLSSVIVSHVVDEGDIFVPGASYVNNSVAHWRYTLGGVFPNAISANQTNDLLTTVFNRYNFSSTGFGNRYNGVSAEHDSLRDAIGDLGFVCNTRLILGAYQGKVPIYSSSNNFASGIHGSDIFSLLFNGANPSKYRRFLMAYAASGDPNTGSQPFDSVNPWSQTGWGSTLTNVVQVTDQLYGSGSDSENTAYICDFWNDFIQKAITVVPYGP